MPLTTELRQGIDRIRDYLYGGGYPDPMSNAEQLSYLMFFYLIEGLDEDNKLRAKGAKRDYTSVFVGEWTIRNPLNAPAKGQATVPASNLRWSVWARAMTGQALVSWLRDEVFPFYAKIAEQSATNFMDGARLGIDEPTMLTQVVDLLDKLHLDEADADTKGDLFEHVLRQIKQAGELGQFRTPRHVIRAIVELVDPRIGETIYDPAAGTAGFLVAAYNHIRLANSSEHGIEEVELDGKRLRRGWGDKLSSAMASQLANGTFYGNDVDPKMVRLATMNLTLRGLPNVRILKRNTLTTTMDRSEKAKLGLPLEGYDVVLANPPFSGKLDRDRIVEDVKTGNSTATELLFLKYMLISMKTGGRCGVVVPEGVLFGSTGAHKELRRQLVENNTVEAVLSLPSGVFQPYSGVKTSVLVFKRGGKTENVMFLHADADGYKMDAQHDTPVDVDDLPVLVDAFRKRLQHVRTWLERDNDVEWVEKWWFATFDELRVNDFDLSESRYRPANVELVEHKTTEHVLGLIDAAALEISSNTMDMLDTRSSSQSLTQSNFADRLRSVIAIRHFSEQITNSISELTSTLFLEMFGDPTNNSKNWPVCFLGDVVQLRSGYAFKSAEYQDTGIPLIRISNIQNEKVSVINDNPRLDPKYLNTHKEYILHEGDILIAMSGATTGKLGLVPNLTEPWLLNQRVGRFVVDTTKCLNEYLMALLSLPSMQKKLMGAAYGAAQPNISPTAAGRLLIPLPPIREQMKLKVQ